MQDLASPVINAFGHSFNTGWSTMAAKLKADQDAVEKTGGNLSDPEFAKKYGARVAGAAADESRLKSAHADYWESMGDAAGARGPKDDRLQRLTQVMTTLGGKQERTPEEDAMYTAARGQFAQLEGLSLPPTQRPTPGLFQAIGQGWGNFKNKIAGTGDTPPSAAGWKKYTK